MSAQDLLSQDEIDALLHGADEKPAEEDNRDANGVVSYDITSQERIVRGRMPTPGNDKRTFCSLYAY